MCGRGSVGCVAGSVGGGSRGRSVCVSDGGAVGDGSWCVIISMVAKGI